MSGESPLVYLFSSDGYEMSVINGNATPSNTRSLLIGGSDGTNTRVILMDGSSRQIIAGAGTAGTSIGGVLSVQGVSGGVSVPVSGTLTPPSDVIPSTVNITTKDTATTSVQYANGQIFITGSPTASSFATFALSSVASVRVQVTGTWTGTLVTEVSDDAGVTYTTAICVQSGVPAVSTSSFIQNFIGRINVSGCTQLRIRAITTMTGTATVLVTETMNPGTIEVTSAGFVTENPQITQITNAGTTTFTTGTYTQVITNLGRKEVHLQVNIKNAPTGAAPSITIQIQEIDPIDLTTVFTGVQPGYTLGPYTTAIITDSYFITYTSAIKITVVVTGIGSSFTGVDLWIVNKEASILYGQTQNGSINPLSAVRMDANNDTIVAGPTASEYAVTYNPELIAGSDGTNVQTLSTNTLGQLFANLGPDTRAIQNNATLIATGSVNVLNVGRKEVLIGIVINGTVSGTTPSLTVTMAEIDPLSGTIMNSPGNSASLGPFTTTNHTSYNSMISMTGAIKVTWTITGGTPSFGGVYIFTADKESSSVFGLTQPGISEPLSAVAMDTSSRTLVAGGASTGTALASTGNPILIAGSDLTSLRTIGAVVDRTVMTAGSIVGVPIEGQSSGVGRVIRLDRMGHQLVGQPTLLFEDPIEGTAINPLLWTSSTVTMTIAQTGGILTLNNAGTTTTATDAIITSIKQFPIGRNQAPVSVTFKQNVSQTTNAFQEFGFGAPVNNTALVGNAVAFCRVSASAVAKLVVVYNGTETVSATATLVATTYYLFHLWIEDGQARLIIESSAGTPLLDTQVALPIGSPAMGAGVTHSPIFSRVYTSGAAGAAPKTNIAAVQVWQWDQATNKPWSHQLVGFGHNSNISPTTFLQTAQFSPSAAPATTSPTTTTCAYSTLGGEYSLSVIAGAETVLGVFGYSVPSPYSLMITDISITSPLVTTTIGSTAVVVEFFLAVVSSAVASNPSSITTANSQVYPLGMFVAPATSAVGTLFSGYPVVLQLETPIAAQPGQSVLILIKQLSGIVLSGGIYRGSVLINGYVE